MNNNKDFEDSSSWIYLILKMLIAMVVLASLLNGCSYLNRKAGLPNDNLIEQTVEAYIESETGIEIDLTPGD